jgi:ankyrin repeat protein
MEKGFLWGCQYGRTSVVGFLLDQGLDVAAKRGCTGLHWAAYSGHADTVRLLLERKAPINEPDETFAGTPLGWGL